MTEGEKPKKIAPAYLLGYILLPVLVLIVGCAVIVNLVDSSSVGAMLMTALLLLTVFWWSFLGPMFNDKRESKRLKVLDDAGFIRNRTFSSSSCTLAVDLQNRNVALLFRWNPGKNYVLPASHITRVWVDDGLGGPGVLKGTSRVSFLLTIDGITVRVNTFTSNHRWKLESDNVLTGISKAEVMVKALKEVSGQEV